MIRFTQEFKTKWLEALRSGKYEQAHRFLRVGNAFCCLGVACEISGRGHWVEVQDAGIYSQPIKKFVFYSGSVVLPYNANIFSNMDPSIPQYLTRLNDLGLRDKKAHGTALYPWDFKKIADYIEANVFPNDKK